MTVIHQHWAQDVWCGGTVEYDDEEKQAHCEGCGPIPDEESKFVRERRIH